MKVKIIGIVCVGKEHGITEGRVFEALPTDPDEIAASHVKCWVMGDAGEKVGLLRREFEVIEK